jgi:hypothetical protein
MCQWLVVSHKFINECSSHSGTHISVNYLFYNMYSYPFLLIKSVLIIIIIRHCKTWLWSVYIYIYMVFQDQNLRK